MVFGTKRIGRAVQWAGEKMGSETKTSHSEEFRALESEMQLRHTGMERLQNSMHVYTKSMSRCGETYQDKEKGLPVGYLGRTMVSHGEDFESDSEFGNCLVSMGRANERIASIQEAYMASATSHWLEGLERSLATMKEYQNARKKLESRRLTYESNMSKIQKSKKEDFRLEDDLRASKAKFDESSEDVYRRMQDIKEAEAESVRDLTNFMDAELDYYERCAEELRRTRQEWVAVTTQGGPRMSDHGVSRRQTSRSTSQSYNDYNDRTERWASRQDLYEEEEPAPEPARVPIRSSRYSGGGRASPDDNRAPRAPYSRSSSYGASSFEPPTSRQPSYQREPMPLPQETQLRKAPTMPAPTNVGALRNNLRPVSRVHTNTSSVSSQDVFSDDYDTGASTGSPDYDRRSESPATSYGSLSRTASNTGLTSSGTVKKAPPPPPPSRAKKPPPPIPTKKNMAY